MQPITMLHVLRICFLVQLQIWVCFTEPMNFQQSDYIPKLERITVVDYNKEVAADVNLVTFKYNRTTTTFNLTATVLIDLGNEIEATLQGYRFASNEYRLFPFRFQVNICDALRNNLFGLGTGIQRCGNFTGCPVKKGTTLHVCHFVPDESKFPPLVPNGKYRVNLDLTHLQMHVGMVHVYVEIIRPIKGG